MDSVPLSWSLRKGYPNPAQSLIRAFNAVYLDEDTRVIFHFHLEYTLYVNQFLKVFEL